MPEIGNNRYEQYRSNVNLRTGWHVPVSRKRQKYTNEQVGNRTVVLVSSHVGDREQ